MMFDALSDTSRVTLSDRAYWYGVQHGYAVRLAGNADIQAVFFVPAHVPGPEALMSDIGGRLYRVLPGAERLTLGQNVNSAIRRRHYHDGTNLHLMTAVEVLRLEEAQARYDDRD
jgi:hypothetical protein